MFSFPEFLWRELLCPLRRCAIFKPNINFYQRVKISIFSPYLNVKKIKENPKND